MINIGKSDDRHLIYRFDLSILLGYNKARSIITALIGLGRKA